MLEVITHPYFIAGVVLIGLFFLFQYLDVWPFIRRAHSDMAIHHESGKVTINNWGRILILYATILILIFTHFKVDLNPINITPIPFTEWELGILLAAIGLLSWINKPTTPNTNSTIEVKSEKTTIGPVTNEMPKQIIVPPAKPYDPTVAPEPDEDINDAEIIKSEPKADKG